MREQYINHISPSMRYCVHPRLSAHNFPAQLRLPPKPKAHRKQKVLGKPKKFGDEGTWRLHPFGPRSKSNAAAGPYWKYVDEQTDKYSTEMVDGLKRHLDNLLV